MSIDGALNGLLKLLIPAAALAAGALAVIAVLDHLTLDRQSAERRALMERSAKLNASALAPGSVLPCLDGSAGEAIEAACEKAIFATPESAAAAVAYTSARLALLSDAQGDAGLADTVAAMRRATELDRYGVVAHVLATRDGCTAGHCAAFDLLQDTAALKANLKAQVFDQYVSRYAEAWNKAPAVAEKQPAPPAGVPVASAPESPAPAAAAGQPVSNKMDYPSSASIPAVSIMNAEPALPKAATEAQAQSIAAQPKPEGEPVPVPAKRPQSPPAR